MSSEAVAPPRRGRIAPIAATVVGVVLALLVVLLATRDDSTTVSSPLLGRVAPPIEAVDYRGEVFDLDRHRGSWVIVNFFSTNCVPCIIEHPELVELAERHRDRGRMEIVSVTFDDRGSAVQAFFERNGGDWPVLVDDTGPIAVSYGVAAVPESYLVAPNGVVAFKILGGVTADGIERLIAQAEGEPEPPGEVVSS